jgi:hypothetical protein
MASNINTSSINANYPIAGQDNDTQGFRDNYSSIKYNFNTAATEITALQSNVSTLQTNAYTNSNVAAFLPTYTGNISAGNLTVTSISYVNQEIINTTDVIGSVITANIITANVVTMASAIQLANLTSSVINAISPVTRGMMVYNYTTGNVQVYNGTKWGNIVLS